MSTFMAKKEELQKKWYLVDAKDKVLGRLCTKIAGVLRGKNKPIFTPHVDTGDYVVVINADKVRLTGKKSKKKIYRWHTFYPGGLKEMSFSDMQKKHPKRIIELAVRGMLPKGRLGEQMFKKLKIYAGETYNITGKKFEILD
ncbi:MAG: 50S ribosomal protein L13 [Candidatus Goldbacteria bacterium]|nr:50S ribosomal protein L13 [Candidatus Goldiibacteriota bacterium]HPD18537.1 50S ribosomal protein L13 [Candidatus Goldiibacteriota bacterium]